MLDKVWLGLRTWVLSISDFKGLSLLTVSLVLLSNLADVRILGKFILVRYASDNMCLLLPKFPEMADSPDLFGSGDDERDPGGGSPSLSDAEMPDSPRRQRMVSEGGACPGGDVSEARAGPGGDDSDQQDQPHAVLTNRTMKRKFSYWRLAGAPAFPLR